MLASSGQPLHWAAEKGSTDVVKLFLDGGADSKMEDESGKTALVYAKENDNVEVANIIMAHLTSQ